MTNDNFISRIVKDLQSDNSYINQQVRQNRFDPRRIRRKQVGAFGEVEDNGLPPAPQQLQPLPQQGSPPSGVNYGGVWSALNVAGGRPPVRPYAPVSPAPLSPEPRAPVDYGAVRTALGEKFVPTPDKYKKSPSMPVGADQFRPPTLEEWQSWDSDKVAAYRQNLIDNPPRDTLGKHYVWQPGSYTTGAPKWVAEEANPAEQISDALIETSAKATSNPWVMAAVIGTGVGLGMYASGATPKQLVNQEILRPARNAFNKAVDPMLRRYLTIEANKFGQTISKELENQYVDLALREMSPVNLTKLAAKQLFRRSTAGGFVLTQEGAAQAESLSKALTTNYVQKFIPRGTQTGAMAFGGKAFVPPVPGGEVPKQSWQMTRAEYNAYAQRIADKSPFPPTAKELAVQNAEWHPMYIQQAIKRGEIIPPEVLKDYPDLAKTAEPAVTPEVTPTTPKETITSGYPAETFTFTGDYSEQVAGAGSRMATRNKRITGYAPIYKNAKGETISDMSQMVKEKPKAPEVSALPPKTKDVSKTKADVGDIVYYKRKSPLAPDVIQTVAGKVVKVIEDTKTGKVTYQVKLSDKGITYTIDSSRATLIESELAAKAEPPIETPATPTTGTVQTDYRVQHQIRNPITTADNLEGGGTGFDWKHVAELHDLTDPSTRQSYNILKSIQGKPDSFVTIYRTVPSNVNQINNGDWITLSLRYAKDMTGDTNTPKVISQVVKGKDIGWDGNDLNEFSYKPIGSPISQPSVVPKVAEPPTTGTVQTGLQGMPFKPAQVDMLGEFSGKEAGKVPITEVPPTMPEGLPTYGLPQHEIPAPTGGVRYNITLPPQKPPVPPVPPTVKPPKPSPAQPEPLKEYTRRNEIIAQATEAILQGRPGIVNRILMHIPVVKHGKLFERPGLAMTGKNEVVIIAREAEQEAGIDMLMAAGATVLDTFSGIEKGFTKKGLQGGKIPVKIVNGKYVLTTEQRRIGEAIHARNNALVDKTVNDYGAKILKLTPEVTPVDETSPIAYTVKDIFDREGWYLPTIDISESAQVQIERDLTPVAKGKTEHRVFSSASERMKEDPDFVPELNVQKLILTLDQFKAGAARGMTFRAVIGGKTKLEVISATHPKLAKETQALQDRLTELRSKIPEARKVIDDFQNAEYATDDLQKLNRDLNDKELIINMAKEDIETFKAEIKQVKIAIDVLKPYWQSANPRGYKFVADGIYKYFPADQAKLITDIRKASNNRFLNTMEQYKAGAFSGDTSPITGIQLPAGFLFDPPGFIRSMMKLTEQGIVKGNLLYAFSNQSLIDRIKLDPARAATFMTLTNTIPAGVPTEFSGGWLTKIPLVGKRIGIFTQGTYNAVINFKWDLWESEYDYLIKKGIPPKVAEVSAADGANKCYPAINTTRLGQSPSRAKKFQSLLTSYSFLRKPAENVMDAASGFVKIGTLQAKRLTPKERLGMRMMTRFVISAVAVSTASAFFNAKAKGDTDEEALKAALHSLDPDPYNGDFLTVQIPMPDGGTFRVPIGAMYRGLFRAMVPAKMRVGDSDIWVPFAGLPNYINNRVTPAVKAQMEMYKNEDFYGQPIRQGNFLQQLIDGIWYEIESALPLTAGTISEGVRTGQSGAYIAEQTIGQFAGLNVNVASLWTRYYDQLGKYSQDDYDKTPDTLNAMEYKNIHRNHPDLEEIQDAAKVSGRVRAPTDNELLTELKDNAKTARDNELDKYAKALNSGTISAYNYDKQRALLKAGYSNYASAIFGAKEILNAEKIAELEAKQQPEDKALDEYMDFQSQLFTDETIPIDWDAHNKKLDDFLKKYNSKIQKYIEDYKNDWINDLPETAQRIEKLRLINMENDTWYDDDYYKALNETSSKPRTQLPTTTPVIPSLQSTSKYRR